MLLDTFTCYSGIERLQGIRFVYMMLNSVPNVEI